MMEVSSWGLRWALRVSGFTLRIAEWRPKKLRLKAADPVMYHDIWEWLREAQSGSVQKGCNWVSEFTLSACRSWEASEGAYRLHFCNRPTPTMFVGPCNGRAFKTNMRADEQNKLKAWPAFGFRRATFWNSHCCCVSQCEVVLTTTEWWGTSFSSFAYTADNCASRPFFPH